MSLVQKLEPRAPISPFVPQVFLLTRTGSGHELEQPVRPWRSRTGRTCEAARRGPGPLRQLLLKSGSCPVLSAMPGKAALTDVSQQSCQSLGRSLWHSRLLILSVRGAQLSLAVSLGGPLTTPPRIFHDNHPLRPIVLL